MTNSRGEGRHRNFSGVPGFGQPAGARVPPRVGEMRRYLAVVTGGPALGFTPAGC
ncbi:hypothetical protein [Streptomyces sp. NPDC001274]